MPAHQWIFIALLVVFFVLAFYRRFLVLSPNQLMVKGADVEDSSKVFRFSIVSNFMLAVLLAVFAAHQVQTPSFLVRLPDFVFGVWLFSLLFLFFVIRFVCNGLIFFALDKSTLFQNLAYLQTYYCTYTITGLWLMALIYAYAPLNNQFIILYLAFAFFCIMLVIGYIKQYELVNKKIKISWYYFILYLCTLEIMPLVYVLKKIMSEGY